MSTIKNGQISLYCYFNKTIKAPGTSFQSPALGQKHVRNVCHMSHSTLVFHQISFWQYLRFKRNKHKCNFHYVAMPMMAYIFNLWISQKHKNPDISRMKHCFVLQMKKLLHIKGYFTVKCSIVAEVAFKFKSYYRCIFFYQGLFHRHQWFTRQQGKGGDHLYSSLSVPPAHKRSDIYKRSHSCM